MRPVALAKSAGLPVAPCLASIALERLIDLVTVIVLFVVYAVGWAPLAMSGDEAGRFALLRRSALLLGLGTLLGLAFLGFLAAKPERTDRLVKPFLRPLPPKIGAKLESILLSFLDGLGSLGSLREVLVVAAASLFLWTLIGFQIWSTLRAFDLVFPFPVSFFVITWAVLGLAIPDAGRRGRLSHGGRVFADGVLRRGEEHGGGVRARLARALVRADHADRARIPDRGRIQPAEPRGDACARAIV